MCDGLFPLALKHKYTSESSRNIHIASISAESHRNTFMYSILFLKCTHKKKTNRKYDSDVERYELFQSTFPTSNVAGRRYFIRIIFKLELNESCLWNDITVFSMLKRSILLACVCYSSKIRWSIPWRIRRKNAREKMFSSGDSILYIL